MRSLDSAAAVRSDRKKAWILLLSLVGCSSTDPDEPQSPLPLGEWTELVGGDWTLAPGDETYLCAKKTLTQAIHVAGFRPIAQAGSHHSVLSISDDLAGPDGVAPCGSAVDGHQVVFAFGLGTGELSLPDGVAATIPAGTRLILNLHLLNATAAPLTGRTGTEVFLVDESSVTERAEVVLAGKATDLEVVPGASTQTGVCTFPEASNVFALMPHMHALGRHLRVQKQAAILYDQDFDVDAQSYTILDPAFSMAPGDQLSVECSYDNPSANTLHFGRYASDEMCYAILVRFPAINDGKFCLD